MYMASRTLTGSSELTRLTAENSIQVAVIVLADIGIRVVARGLLETLGESVDRRATSNRLMPFVISGPSARTSWSSIEFIE